MLGTRGRPEGHGGRDIDAMIAGELRHISDPWRASHLDFVPDDEEYMLHVLRAAVAFKESFAGQDVVRRSVALGFPALEMDLRRLGELTRGLLAGTVETCQDLLTEVGLAPQDLDGVMLVGGSTFLPVVRPYLEEQLRPGGPILPALDPVTAVVDGAAEWAARGPGRGASEPRPAGQEPLSWSLPGGRATFVRWLAEPGDGFRTGAVLARVRLGDNSLYELAAREAGRLERCHVWPGDAVYSGGWTATMLRRASPADLLAQPRPLRRWVESPRAVALSPTGRRIAVSRAAPGQPDEAAQQLVVLGAAM